MTCLSNTRLFLKHPSLEKHGDEIGYEKFLMKNNLNLKKE